LSYQIIDDATQETEKAVDKFFPWPEDKSRVSLEAINVNGLTEDYLATKDLSERYDAIDEFYDDMDECDLIVAHNGDFDKRFIIVTAEREGIFRSESWKPMIDTMKTTTDLCKLPPHPGRTGYKWPKLIVLAEFLQIRTDDINLHDSSADVELTKRCFLYLLEHKFYRL
jgi:DNA polymerase III alpha subunit (gram-positive type)